MAPNDNMDDPKYIDSYSDHSGPKMIEEGTSKKGHMARLKMFRKNFLLPLLFIIAMCLGIGIGWLVRYLDPSFTQDPRRIMYLRFPGELLLSMLKMMIIPLIVSSLVCGTAALQREAAGKLGAKMIAYYLGTVFLAVLMGILMVSIIRPGDKAGNISVGVEKNTLVEPVDAFLDLFRNAFPPNIVEATFRQIQTQYTTEEVEYNETIFNATGTEMNDTVVKTEDVITGFELGRADNTNVIGLVVFSIAFGLLIRKLGPRADPLATFFELTRDVIIELVRIIIWYSPFGITFLLAAQIVSMEDPERSFAQLLWYILTVTIGLALHAFVVLPVIYAIFARRNPFKLFLHVGPALLMALSTASSAATMPVTLRCLRDRAGIDDRISNFVIPIGTTINMDGTALYEAVASIFIAQYNNIPLSAGQVVTVSITSTVAAIGAAGVPEAGLVTMLIVLTAVGLPLEDVGLIYAVDWFLDRLRTSVNVWGDSLGAGLVDATTELSEIPTQNQGEPEEPKLHYDDYPYIIANPDFQEVVRL